MDSAEDDRDSSAIQPVRTIGIAVLGGTAGASVLAGVVSQLFSDGEGLATLGAAIVAGAIGALGGVAAAVAIDLRDRAGRFRRVAVLTVLLGGPPACALVAWGMAQTALFEHLDTRHLFVVWLGVVLPGTAVVGRWLASKTSAVA